MKTFVPAALVCSLLLLAASFARAQVAPAGDVLLHPDSTRYYFFRSEGSFVTGATFLYVNYQGEVDAANPTVSPNGSFSAVSNLGRSVSGQISETTITINYNGSSVSGPKLSSYGPTRALAGLWTGPLNNSATGIGVGAAHITSQGQVIVSTSQGFSFDVGVGTVDASGNFSVPLLLSGLTMSGNAFPSFGRINATFNLSNGQTANLGLVRAIPSRLANISTRGFVGSGEQVLIGGFIVIDGGKTVLMNAKGPSLAAAGVASPVQATQISLYLGSQLIASNNGWRNNGNSSEIAASGLAPTDDRESALQVALEPGAYTVIVSSADGSTGIGLVEVFGVGDTEGP